KTPEELRDMIYPDDHGALDEYYSKFPGMKDNEAAIAEYRAKNDLGDWVWYRVRGKVFQRNETGKITHILNIIQNINEQKLASAAANAAEEKIYELNKILTVKNRELASLNSELTT